MQYSLSVVSFPISSFCILCKYSFCTPKSWKSSSSSLKAFFLTTTSRCLVHQEWNICEHLAWYKSQGFFNVNIHCIRCRVLKRPIHSLWLGSGVFVHMCMETLCRSTDLSVYPCDILTTVSLYKILISWRTNLPVCFSSRLSWLYLSLLHFHIKFRISLFWL